LTGIDIETLPLRSKLKSFERLISSNQLEGTRACYACLRNQITEQVARNQFTPSLSLVCLDSLPRCGARMARMGAYFLGDANAALL
jgi:hypothetical protein